MAPNRLEDIYVVGINIQALHISLNTRQNPIEKETQRGRTPFRPLPARRCIPTLTRPRTFEATHGAKTCSRIWLTHWDLPRRNLRCLARAPRHTCTTMVIVRGGGGGGADPVPSQPCDSLQGACLEAQLNNAPETHGCASGLDGKTPSGQIRRD